MYKNNRIVAVIPARAGSTGLPGKNILPFCGKPLLAWSVEAAKLSRYIDAVVISTDSPKIAGIGRKFGAETPFLRPRGISGPAARSIDAVFHAVDFLRSKGRLFDFVILLQPTSPLRTVRDIDGAIRLCFKRKAEAVVSVCKAEHSPLLSARLSKDLLIREFVGQGIANIARQSLPDYYRVNGAVYFSSIDRLRRNDGFLSPGVLAYVMPQERSVDIDTRYDFMVAEFLRSHGADSAYV